MRPSAGADDALVRDDREAGLRGLLCEGRRAEAADLARIEPRRQARDRRLPPRAELTRRTPFFRFFTTSYVD